MKADGLLQRRVLVVEDDADTRWGVCALLELEGHVVDEAQNGPDGLKALLAGGYDVAFVDLNLPGMSGYDLARIVRQAAKRTALIAFTGVGPDSDRENGLEAGFDAYLLSPSPPKP